MLQVNDREKNFLPTNPYARQTLLSPFNQAGLYRFHFLCEELEARSSSWLHYHDCAERSLQPRTIGMFIRLPQAMHHMFQTSLQHL